ncbi:MAG: GTP 3',8-cyclase MoaA [Hyphomonadaceae bacterium]
MSAPAPLLDGAGRRISYVRISITDRCDLRCTYCMPARPDFLPKRDMLTFDELDRLCAVFVRNGVRRMRITGGEPLVRPGAVDFIGGLSRHLRSGGLDEISLTTNATQLARHAEALAAAGVRRVNISLDTLDRAVFQRICRSDKLMAVLDGIHAAMAAGLTVRLNTVALARDNRHELADIIGFAHHRGMSACLIETMPLGETGEDRTDQFVSLAEVRADLERYWRLEDVDAQPGSGPARYVRVRETGGLLGFITPLSHNFCALCNRVRLTATGKLYLCLGHETNADFRDALRSGVGDAELDDLYRTALRRKPLAHQFAIGRGLAPTVQRSMAVTGG